MLAVSCGWNSATWTPITSATPASGWHWRAARAICLIPMNYWSNRAAGLERVWDDVLRTLVFGEPIADSTAGPVIQ